MSTQARPTTAQLKFLRTLAQRTGETFAYPHNKQDASSEIRRLLDRKSTTRVERSSELRAIQREMAERPNDACRVRQTETAGHGATAAWS